MSDLDVSARIHSLEVWPSLVMRRAMLIKRMQDYFGILDQRKPALMGIGYECRKIKPV